jgi:ABC-2 type transport system ATP-binding protein
VIDLGKVIAEGTQDELKTQIGGEVVELVLTKVADRAGDLERVHELLRDLASAEPVIDHEAHAVRLPVEGGAAILAEAVRRLDGAGVTVSELSLHRPTLDDVFLTLTGRHVEADKTDEDGDGAPGPVVRSAAAECAPEGRRHDRDDSSGASGAGQADRPALYWTFADARR